MAVIKYNEAEQKSCFSPRPVMEIPRLTLKTRSRGHPRKWVQDNQLGSHTSSDSLQC